MIILFSIIIIISSYFTLSLLNEDEPNIISKKACEARGKQMTRDYGPLPDGMHCGEWKCVDMDYDPTYLKPVIYLYPEIKQDTDVKLDYNGA